MKIALVKQDVYADLYVASRKESDPAEVLFSSMMRVGPYGLIENLEADFIIVKEEDCFETQIYRQVIPQYASKFRLLKTHTLNEIPGFKSFEPGSPLPNGYYAVDASDVDWGEYDVVISVNVSIPTKLVRKFPSTLFAYMIGEANFGMNKVRFGYDVVLNQKARGIYEPSSKGVIDFPYTFLSDSSIESAMRRALGREPINEGVFVEVNSVMSVVELGGRRVYRHSQNIKTNLTNLYDAKYFIKCGGRFIRGNSVAEAISSGTLVLINRDDIVYRELIPDGCNVNCLEDALTQMTELDNNPSLYDELLRQERERVQKYLFDAPLNALKLALNKKRSDGPESYSLLNRAWDFLFIQCVKCKNLIKFILKKMHMNFLFRKMK